MPRANSPLRREVTWSGLRAGDAVVVNLDRERRRHYRFVAYVQNTETGEEWVEVRGGRTGEAKDRSFRPDVIFPDGTRRGATVTGPALVDAPRLPLG